MKAHAELHVLKCSPILETRVFVIQLIENCRERMFEHRWKMFNIFFIHKMTGKEDRKLFNN